MGDTLRRGLLHAPHLAHAEAKASFDPIPLGANLPTSLSAASDEFRLKYIHEYAHFLQAATTFLGANRMHTFFWSMSGLRKLLLSANGSLSKLDIQEHARQFREKQDALNCITHASLLESEVEIFAETELRGFHHIDNGIVKFPAFLRHIESARVSVAPVSVKALQESMAMAVERWIEPELTKSLYDAIISLENREYFEYAVVPETLRSIADWPEKTVFWTTIVVCDVALDHYTPLSAFTLIIGYLRKHYSLKIPSLDNLSEFHLEMRTACYIEPAEVDRANLVKELSRVVALPSKESAPSDWVFAEYFGLFLKAQSVRSSKPHAFVERLLFLTGKCPDEIRDFESIPYYSTPQDLLSSRPDSTLVTAGLATICLQHFSKYLVAKAELIGDPIKRCPLFDRPGNCDYTKGPHCQSAPWLAPVENDESCVYRFATDALGVNSE